MKLPIDKIKPNPRRSFDLYPMDPEQIAVLRKSIHDLGFFSGLTARPHPTMPGYYQLAAGHHRLEAARLEGLKEVEAVVENYSDKLMTAVMTAENMTQRGNNAAAALDSVAAHAYDVSKEILLCEDGNDKILSLLLGKHGFSLDTLQAEVVENGPGPDILFRVINNVGRTENDKKDGPSQMSAARITNALETLRASGAMARIIGDVVGEVHLIRTEREDRRRAAAAAAAKAEAEAKAKAEAAAKTREAELARQRAAEEEAKRKADAARKTAERAAADKKAEADRKAAEAKADADARATARKNAEAEAAKKAKADADRAKEAQAKADKEAERAKAAAAQKQREAAALAAQKAKDAIYDSRCVHLFQNEHQAKAFFDAVTAPDARKLLPKEKQFELAQMMIAELKAARKGGGGDLTAPGIQRWIGGRLAEALGISRDFTKQEKADVLRRDKIKRINQAWKNLRTGLVQAESSLAKLAAEYAQWGEPTPAPYNSDALDLLGEFIDKAGKLHKRLTKN
jgi:chemotaxis protein histidine kinase CheA